MLVIKNIAQVLTLQGSPAPLIRNSMAELGIIENGAILSRAGRITWVGPTRDLPVRDLDRKHQILDGAGLNLVAMPGFVDSHTHPVFAGTRALEYELRTQGKTYQEIAALGGGIQASVRQTRGAGIDQLVTSAERYFELFLSHGTTTVEAKSGYGLSLEHEVKMLESLAILRERSRLQVIPTFLGAHAFPEEHRESRDDYVREIIRVLIPRVARGKPAG